MYRRTLLGSAVSLSLGALAGCVSAPEGEGNEVEIIPSNETDERRQVTVEVASTEGTLLLNHTYELDPDETDESRGVEDDVASVSVRVPGIGEASTEYDPDVDCGGGEDVGIRVLPDGIEFYYSC